MEQGIHLVNGVNTKLMFYKMQVLNRAESQSFIASPARYCLRFSAFCESAPSIKDTNH
jgi:hypothetical protein